VLAAAVFLLVLGIVVAAAGVYRPPSPSSHNQNPASGTVPIASNGTNWDIEPSNLSSNSYQDVGPIDLTSNSSWTTSGTFTASYAVRAIFMTASQYSSWERDAYEEGLPSGSYVWATGNVLSGSVNATLAAGTYYLVWDNINLFLTTLVHITTPVIATASTG
jgi:hypothetical protein